MIGKKIRQLRELKGYNQVNLSTEINISQKQLSRIESQGKRIIIITNKHT